MRIKCCKDCVPPKRHVGCHTKCEQYLKERAVYDTIKAKAAKSKILVLTAYDFDEIVYGHCKRRKRKFR